MTIDKPQTADGAFAGKLVTCVQDEPPLRAPNRILGENGVLEFYIHTAEHPASEPEPPTKARPTAGRSVKRPVAQ
jgi:hypothetical protein